MTAQDELLEEWDWEEAIPTGRVVSRKKAHSEGIAHEGVHLWVFRTVNGFPEILFQHRASSKEMYPDCLDITVGGHVPFGRGDNKIQKESFEEIGIVPSDDNLIDLGYYRYEEITKEMFHREFQRVYILHDNRALRDYRFNDGEVDGIYAVPLIRLEDLLQADSEFIIKGYDGHAIVDREVSRRDFHPLLFAPSMEKYMDTVIQGIRELFHENSVAVRMPSPKL
jgi:isopentenyldiphosphate isomerase